MKIIFAFKKLIDGNIYDKEKEFNLFKNNARIVHEFENKYNLSDRLEYIEIRNRIITGSRLTFSNTVTWNYPYKYDSFCAFFLNLKMRDHKALNLKLGKLTLKITCNGFY